MCSLYSKQENISNTENKYKNTFKRMCFIFLPPLADICSYLKHKVSFNFNFFLSLSFDLVYQVIIS